MGVPQEVPTLHIQRAQERSSKSSPRGLSKRSSFRRQTSPAPVDLPPDVLALKQKILETHPAKLTRFSLSHMRHVAVPPVQIPKTLNGRRAVSTVVAGKSVPITMRMWANCKKKAKRMDMIDEYVRYR